MRRHAQSVALVAVAMLSLAAPSAAAPPAQESFIVVLQPGTRDVPAAAASLGRQAGGTVGFVYEHALQGFSITASPAAAQGLERNPQVAFVETDDPVSIEEQAVPTGIDRTFASANTGLDIDGSDDFRVDVDVAVLDTGIDRQHPDLNVVDGTTCKQNGPFGTPSCSGDGDDDHYHGTHVAGTIGALDNEFGVVGIAPGARLWAVKVLDSRGSGYTSQIIAGIDWVADRADTIEVANMSLGGRGVNLAYDVAIGNAAARGVAFAVAAGNSDMDASNYSPAYTDHALTVSALADFDGKPGGLGSPTCRTDGDDTLADFSNWGSAVDIAAPGVCIESTYPIEQGEYGTISGTSMASPHVAGALALLASGSPSQRPTAPELYSDVLAAANGDRNPWTDDSGDGIQEPLLDVRAFTAVLIEGASGTGTDTGGGGSGTQDPPADDAGGSSALVSSSSNAGKTWTAQVTLQGSSNDLSGTWDFAGVDNCDGATCTLSEIAKKTPSVTFVPDDTDLESITILKP